VAGSLIAWCALNSCCPVDRRQAGLPAPLADADRKGAAAEKRSMPAVDLTSQALPSIPVGTVIDKKAPKGWTHLILFATPTLTKEDLAEAPKTAAHYAQLLKFVLLARTARDKDGHYLDTVARGFAVNISGKNTVINSNNTLRAEMGLFGGRILKENEEVVEKDLVQVARTPTLAIIDGHAVMRQGTDHVKMVMRHAVLVDPTTGKLSTFVWLLSKGADGYAPAEKALQLLPANMQEARYLSVKRDRFFLGMPTADAFALRRIPQGKPVPYSAKLKKLAALQTFTKAQVPQLESALRAAAARKR
jgi:hypothetical protein